MIDLQFFLHLVVTHPSNIARYKIQDTCRICQSYGAAGNDAGDDDFAGNNCIPAAATANDNRVTDDDSDDDGSYVPFRGKRGRGPVVGHVVRAGI